MGVEPTASHAPRGFGGLRVVAFESRMAAETARLIEKSGGIALSAPSMREVPLGDNPRALAFAADLLAGPLLLRLLPLGLPPLRESYPEELLATVWRGIAPATDG